MTQTISKTAQTGCPKCGCRDLKVSAIQHITAYVTFRGDDNHQMYDEAGGDTEWSDSSEVECTNCNHDANLSEFVIPAGTTRCYSCDSMILPTDERLVDAEGDVFCTNCPEEEEEN